MSTGDMKQVSCSSGSPCAYRCMSGGSMGFTCGYTGYCDHQLPRDSRMPPLAPYYPPYQIGGGAGTIETCPYCHLPLSQCKGHATCI